MRICFPSDYYTMSLGPLVLLPGSGFARAPAHALFRAGPYLGARRPQAIQRPSYAITASVGTPSAGGPSVNGTGSLRGRSNSIIRRVFPFMVFAFSYEGRPGRLHAESSAPLLLRDSATDCLQK
jgi:hypothetical protein